MRWFEGRQLVTRECAHEPVAEARRVLVADRDGDTADSLALLLQLEGHDVRVAYSGEHALVLSSDFLFDVGFLDVQLPDFDGCDLARRLRARDAGFAPLLVAVTGNCRAEIKRRALATGFDAYWYKPVDPEHILAVLRDPALGAFRR
jgi:two-component system, OmpR family, response regulator